MAGGGYTVYLAAQSAVEATRIDLLPLYEPAVCNSLAEIVLSEKIVIDTMGFAFTRLAARGTD